MNFSLTILLALILNACGGGSNNSSNGGATKKTDEPPPPVNYWQGVDFKELPTAELPSTSRSLNFTDGIDITAEFDENDGSLTSLCRVQTKNDTAHRICLGKDDGNAWVILCGEGETEPTDDCSQVFSEEDFCTKGDDIEDTPTLTCLDGWGGVAFEGDDEGYAAKRICRTHKRPNVPLSGKCFDGVKQEGENYKPRCRKPPNHHLGGLPSIPLWKETVSTA